MAHKESVQNEGLVTYLIGHRFFYNLHSGVGWGYPNRKDDVLLIQYFINDCFTFEGKATLDEDGIFGPKTQKAIKLFQKEGGENHADGVVNEANGTKHYSSKTKTVYTIYSLNQWYLSGHPLYYKDLRMAPNLPQPLAQALSKV